MRALHFPISHSFSHTNMKSPCAEQKDTLKFKKVVIEGGGDLRQQEAIAVTLKMVRRMGANHPEEVFDMMDVDRDGLLTGAEIGRCCKYMGMDITNDAELTEIVRLIDSDGDNLVDR